MPLRDLHLPHRITLPKRLLSQRFARSSGAGGQNVNKVETKVDLRLDLAAAEPFLGETRTRRIRSKLARRIDGEDHLQVTADEHRERNRNLEAAIARMETLLTHAMHEAKRRRPTKPTRASKERRLTEKRRHAERKQRRSTDDV